MKEQVIALFPLPLVLFPQSLYPLRIFEPRYQTLLDQCLGGREGFGILPVIDGKVMNYGCFAEVVKVTAVHPEGERDIIVKGTWRFTLSKMWKGKKGFHIGVATPQPPLLNDYANPLLLEEVDGLFSSALKKTELELDAAFYENLRVTQFKSFKYAEKIGMTTEEQLKLLMTETEDERLNVIKHHIQDLLHKVEGYLNLKRIIENDGYINIPQD